MRKFFSLMIAIVLIAVLFIPLANASAHTDTQTPIKHVINIFLENHTFDNFFGTYPENQYSANQSLINNMSRPVNLLQNQSLLNSVSAVPPGQFSTADPVEGYLAYHTDWNYGKMNNFVLGSGPQSMTYYTSSQLGPLWDLAEQYSIADNYFAPQLSESAPNTLYYLAGFAPVFNDYGPPPSIPYSETIFGELSQYNISWNAFVNHSYTESFDMSSIISGINSHLNNIQSWNSLKNDLANGTMPAVSWVFAQDAGNTDYDMGAPANLLQGELWILYLIDKIESSPIWNSTVVFITWDDPGGYYDQVSPPVFDGQQLGMRLPLLVISPYAKEDYISNTLMNHASILAFIDYNWNLPALNKFVSYSDIPLDMFNFNTSYSNGLIARAPISFTSFPIPANISFTLPSDTYNFSSIYPMPPQYPFNSLTYSRSGNSAVNLSDLNAGVFVKNDYAITPFYYTPLFFILLVLLASIMIAAIILKKGDAVAKK